jgi:hypothetical protein
MCLVGPALHLLVISIRLVGGEERDSLTIAMEKPGLQRIKCSNAGFEIDCQLLGLRDPSTRHRVAEEQRHWWYGIGD